MYIADIGVYTMVANTSGQYMWCTGRETYMLSHIGGEVTMVTNYANM